MDNLKINQKFKEKLLGVRNNGKKPNYFLDDFLNQTELVEFIVSTYDHESSFTKDGFEFIEEYYGLDKIIELVSREYPDYPFDEGVSPMNALLVKKRFAIDIENNDKEKIIIKYKNKILATESFGDNRKKFVSDFSNIGGLLYVLQQLNTHEISLTDDGLRFIDEYYGLDKVADMILERIKEGVDFKYKTREDLLMWLKNKGD